MRLGLGLGNDVYGQSRGGVFGGLLLDKYSGAAAAYSLRKLSSDTTNVVRVRRSSDNAEQDFTATEVTDGTLETWVGANDGFVTTWYDQSGNSNDATQATASEQPKIVDAGVLVEENGRPAILPVNRTNYFAINPLTLTSDTWVFSTIKNPLGQTTAFIEGDTGNKFILITSETSTSTLVNNLYTPISLYKDGAAFNPTTRQDAYNGLVNQSLITANFDGSISTFINIGYPSSALIGMFQIQEFIIYDTDQSSNRISIENNINSYYNIY